MHHCINETESEAAGRTGAAGVREAALPGVPFNPDTEKAHELRQKFADLEAELMCDETGTRAFTSSKSESLVF